MVDAAGVSRRADLLFRHVRDAVAVFEVGSGRVIHWNPAAEQLLGYPAEEVIGQPFGAFVPGLGTVAGAVRLAGPVRLDLVGKDGARLTVEAVVERLERATLGRPSVMAVLRPAPEPSDPPISGDRARANGRWREAAEGLRALLAAANASRAVDEILDLSLGQAVRLFGADAGGAYLMADDDGTARLSARAARGLRAGQPADTLALTDLVVPRRRPVAIPDLLAALADGGEAEPAASPENGRGPVTLRRLTDPPPTRAESARPRRLARRFRAALVVPLATGDRVHGAVTLLYRSARTFAEEDVELALGFGHGAGLAVESAGLRGRAEQRPREVAEELRDLLTALNASRPLEELLDAVLSQAGRLLGSAGGAVYLRDDREGGGHSDLLTVQASRGLEAAELAARLRVGSPVTGLSVLEGRPVVCADLTAALADDIVNARESQVVEHPGYLSVLRMGPRMDPDLESGPSARVRRLTDRFRAVLAVPLMVRGRAWGAAAQYYREPRQFSDEDVELAAAFGDRAALAIENAHLRARAEERLRGLEALYDADEKLHGSLRVSDVLAALVDVATDVLRADKSTVMIWDERRERLVVGAVRGFAPEVVADMAHTPGQSLTSRVARTREIIAVEDARADPRVARRITDPEGIRSLIHVPVVVGGDVFGVFGVHYCQPHTFTADERRLLSALAQRAALAIDNARLYEQAQQAAAMEERQRLARELHDAVTQTLFSARLIADVLPRIWARDPAQGLTRLEELRELTRGALAEMRTLLLELRPSALGEAALGDLLRQLAEAFIARARVPLDLRVEGGPEPPADVRIVLYRVAQEALHNVAKHAAAVRVEVDLRLGPGRAELLIRDDGRGFEPSEVPPGHLGLSIMRERAEAIGAALALESRPGGGARVTVAWSEPDTGRSGR